MAERIVERLIRKRDARCGDGIYTTTSPSNTSSDGPRSTKWNTAWANCATDI